MKFIHQYFLRSLVIALFCSIASNSFAAKERFVNAVQGFDIIQYSSVAAQDQRYNQMQTSTTWQDEFKNEQVDNLIQLKIDRYSTSYIGAAFFVELNLKLEKWDASGVMTVENIKLKVDYNPVQGVIETDADIYAFSNKHFVNVRVTSINTNAPNGIVPSSVKLENIIEIDRLYRFYPTEVITINTRFLNSNEHIEFYWTDASNAGSYELEWLFIEDYDVTKSNYLAASALNYDFKKRSVRVTTINNHYQIPYVFSHGYILYRVRGLGKNWTSNSFIQRGNWSNNTWQGVVSTFANKTHLTNDHEYGRMNWSFSAAYAENGKKTETVGYIDGTGKTRQSVGYNPDVESAIVSEVIYDFHGRPALEMMPVPSYENRLGFHLNFNQDNANGSLNWEDFDKDRTPIDPCKSEDFALGTNSGAGKYYSPNNTNQNEQQAYLPDAQGYAYARVEYMPDATGRAKSLTAVGPTHKLGSGKETNVHYSSAPMSLLYKYFDKNDIGDPGKYSQIVVIDANSQQSTRVYDSRGNLILSGLTGVSPSNVSALSNTVTSLDTTHLLGGDRRWNSSRDTFGHVQKLPLNRDDSWLSVETIFANTAGNYTFKYKLNPADFISGCLPAGFCYDCEYYLYISLIDENCGTVVHSLIDTLTASPYDSTCSDSSLATSFTRSLTVGSYKLIKKLVVSESVVNKITDSYMANSKCLKTANDFYKKYVDLIDFTSCYGSYCEYECIKSIGSLDSFLVNNPTLDTADWNSQMAACRKDCENVTPCESMLQRMKFDLRPGGQYGLIYNSSFTLTPASYPLSIYNETNSLPSGKNWRNATGFVDKYGNPDSLTNSLGVRVVPNHSSITLAQFIKHWKTSWALSLVSYHPEYCYYTFCTQQAASHRYDERLKNTSTFKMAEDSGYFNPLKMTTGSGVPNFPKFTNPHLIDSFFVGSGAGLSFLGDLQDSLRYYYKLGSSNYTIWQVALVLLNCPEDTTEAQWNTCLTNHTFANLCQENRYWQIFRWLYLKKKQVLYDQLITKYAIEKKCYNGCIGVQAGHFKETVADFNCYPKLMPPACTSNASNYNGYWDTIQPCDSSTYALYQGKKQIYSSHLDTLFGGKPLHIWNLGMDSIADSMRTTWCQNNCDSAADAWMAALKPCTGMNTADSIYIRTEFLELCKMGCDSMRILGIRTTPPGLTTSNGHTSFHDILDSILGPNYANDTCNSLLIPAPDPYNYVPMIMSGFLDTCSCKNILEAGTSNAYSLAYGDTILDFNERKCDCESAYKKATNSTWISGNPWPADAAKRLASLRIPMPLGVGCGQSCIGCSRLSELKDSLKIEHNIDTSHSNYYQLLARYANWKLNFNMDASAYYRLDIQCNGINGTPAKCTPVPTAEALELEKFINEAAFQGRLGSTYATVFDISTVSGLSWWPSSLIKSKYAGNNDLSLCDGTMIIGSPLCNDSIMRFAFGDEAKRCQVNLFLPDSVVQKGFKLYDLVGFKNIIPRNAGCTSTSEFSATVTFFDVNGKAVDFPIIGDACFPIAEGCCGDTLLCNIPSFPNNLIDTNRCQNELLKQARELAFKNYKSYLDSTREAIYDSIFNHCLNGATDSMTMFSPFTSSQYTLYYYDAANTLVQTVAPKGVGTAGSHTLETQYRYNSYNQVKVQKSPDGGESKFYYDKAHRLVLSQNEKQLNDVVGGKQLLSYTLYDEIGRPYEVGEIRENLPSSTVYKDPTTFKAWFTGKNRSEVTRTYYDKPINQTKVLARFDGGTQKNLRRRIAMVGYYETYPISDLLYDHATYYSYDAHGNVTQNIEDVRLHQLPFLDLDITDTRYDYELISGNVDEVVYQKDKADELRHKYTYDENNRLQQVHTSTNNVIWDRDAKYYYYDHGPMARVETGEHKVNAQDYAYTLQGWIKGLNSNSLQAGNEPGHDGFSSASTNTGLMNSQVARDAFSYSLGYYTGDYTAISNVSSPNPSTYFLANQTGSGLASSTTDMYNGNISQMITSIEGMDVQASVYGYDQLNRLLSVDVFHNINTSANNWNTGGMLSDYKTRIAYDANGNITTLLRNGYGSNLDMDNLSYAYKSSTNQLDSVHDAVTTSTYTTDIKNGQTSGNYSYDKIGNLVADLQEGIINIDWNVYGKVKTIDKGGPGQRIHFYYNALGQRAAKKVERGTLLESDWTFYRYDAGGNLMATYNFDDEWTDTYQTVHYDLGEQYLYGSSRLGVINRNKRLRSYDRPDPGLPAVVDSIAPHDSLKRMLGHKQYELSNHLGNVLVTQTDRKLKNNGNTISIEEFSGASVPSHWITTSNGTLNMEKGKLKLETATNNVAMERFYNVTAGTNYSISMDIDKGNTGLVYIEAFDVTNGWVWLREKSLNTGANEWVLTAPAGCSQIFFKIKSKDPSGPLVHFYLDNFQVRALASANTLTYNINTWSEAWSTSDATLNINGVAPNQTLGVNVTNSWKGSYYNFTTETGARYLVTVGIKVGSCAGIGIQPSDNGGTPLTYKGVNADGTYKVSFQAISNSTNIIVMNSSTPTTCGFTIESFKIEVLEQPEEPYYLADISSKTDYYSFGMTQPGRSTNPTNYRHGFNGMEFDNETKTDRNHYSTYYRQYDPRLGRWFSTDPLVHPFQSPYTAFNNNPVVFADPRGDKGEKGNYKGSGMSKRAYKNEVHAQRRQFRRRKRRGEFDKAPEGYDNAPHAYENMSVTGYTDYKLYFVPSNSGSMMGRDMKKDVKDIVDPVVAWLRKIDGSRGGDHFTADDAVGAQNATLTNASDVKQTDVTEILAVANKSKPAAKATDIAEDFMSFYKEYRNVSDKPAEEITYDDLVRVGETGSPIVKKILNSPIIKAVRNTDVAKRVLATPVKSKPDTIIKKSAGIYWDADGDAHGTYTTTTIVNGEVISVSEPDTIK